MRHSLIALIVILLVTVPFASANDTAVTLGAGGLVLQKTSQIAMQSEQLEISVHKIRIRYVFRNTGNRDVDLLVAFPLPDLNGALLYNSPVYLPNEKAVNFVDFAVSADGKTVHTDVELRAFDGERDITSRLKKVGLSGNVLMQDVNEELSRVPDSQRKLLEDEQLIVRGEFNPALPGIGKSGWWPTWTMRVKFYWKQHFPAHRAVELVQTYRPVVGGSYIVSDDSGKASVGHYCGTAETLRRIAEAKRRHPVGEGETFLWERTIDYILTTGNNWRGPIGRFRLIVSTDSPRDILTACMSGLTKVGPGRYQFEATSYRPAADLKLLILQEADPYRGL